MKLREMSFVLLRLMAIWFILSIVIPSIWGILFSIIVSNSQFYPDRISVLTLYSTQGIIFLILSGILWFKTKDISLLIFKGESEVETPINTGKIIEIGLTLIGTYLIISSLSGLISNLYSLAAKKSSQYWYYGDSVKNIITYCSAIIIGIICILGNTRISGIIDSLKGKEVSKSV